MYFLSIISIFKNEGHIINEWIEHHILEGVEHFYLIDNGSQDNYVIEDKYLSKITLIFDDTKYAQIKLLNKHFLELTKKESIWVISIDLDEFMYSRREYNTISEYLKNIKPSISQIGVPWKMFGSSGYIYQPSNVIKHFIYRSNESKMVAIKTIVKTEDLISYEVHSHKTYDDTILLNTNILKRRTVYMITESFLDKSFIHLNHYPIQSFEFFRKIKMTRGDINSTLLNNIRTTKYFNEYDEKSNYLDDELKHKRYGFDTYNFTLSDVKLYGVGIYLDVTNYKIKPNKSYNDLFGDPVPYQKKYYIIRKNNILKIFNE